MSVTLFKNNMTCKIDHSNENHQPKQFIPFRLNLSFANNSFAWTEKLQHPTNLTVLSL